MKNKKLLLSFLVITLVIFIAYNLDFEVSDKSLGNAAKDTTKNLYNISLIIAFLGGILTLFAPCLLPFIPAYVGYSIKEKKNLTLMTLIFFSGFTLVFLLLGFSVSLIGQFLIRNQSTLIFISGIFIIIFGFMTLLNFGFKSPLKVKSKFSKNYIGNFLFGIFFAIGWAPCVGPILFSILFMAANSTNLFNSSLIILSYSLGIFLPFLILSHYIESKKLLEMNLFKKEFKFSFFKRHHIIAATNLMAGLLFIFLGAVYIIFGGTSFLNRDFFGLWGANYVFQSKILQLSFLNNIFIKIFIIALVVLLITYLFRNGLKIIKKK